MKLLSFYLGLHDSNVTLFDGTVKYFKSERMTQIKHHHASLEWVNQICESQNFTPDAVAYSDGGRNKLDQQPEDQTWIKVDNITIRGASVPAFCLDHHYAHILSCWPIRPVADLEYGVAIDGKGDYERRFTIIKNPGNPSPEIIFSSKHHAYADFFNSIGRHMALSGGALDFGGKVMGAHAYGEVDNDYVQNNFNSSISKIPYKLISEIRWGGIRPKLEKSFFDFSSPNFRNWLASVHELIGRLIIDKFTEYVPRGSVVAYAGGAAQNTVYNETLFGIYPEIIIPPHCYDGGLSLGCLEFLRIKYNLEAFDTSGFPYWQSDSDVGFADEDVIEKVVHHLQKGKIVGWLQGKGEIGPRALGHRSILFDPRIPNGKDFLNSTVKKREKWRPYAPSILETEVDSLIGEMTSSPFMLRAVRVRDDVRELFPSIIHMDGSSRIQTVRPDQGESQTFHHLLETLYRQEGCPALLNTSFNAAGGPVVSNAEQALRMWKETELDVLCVGNELHVK